MFCLQLSSKYPTILKLKFSVRCRKCCELRVDRVVSVTEKKPLVCLCYHQQVSGVVSYAEKEDRQWEWAWMASLWKWFKTEWSRRTQRKNTTKYAQVFFFMNHKETQKLIDNILFIVWTTNHLISTTDRIHLGMLTSKAQLGYMNIQLQ